MQEEPRYFVHSSNANSYIFAFIIINFSLLQEWIPRRWKRKATSKPRAFLFVKPKTIRFTSCKGSAGGATSEVGALQIEGSVPLVPLEVLAIARNIRALSSVAGVPGSAQFMAQIAGSVEQGTSVALLASISDRATVLRAFRSILLPTDVERFVGA